MKPQLDINFIRSALNQNAFRILYNRNKEYILPSLVLVASFVLVVGVIIPQIRWFIELSKQNEERAEKIAVLRSNLNFLSSLNDEDLDAKVQTTSLALPLDKDFSGILRAISLAAAESGVALGDFSFEIGELSASSAAKTNGKPAIEITLNISGGLDGSSRFLHTLSQKMPLSRVSGIRIEEASSILTTSFYYRPYVSSANLNKALEPLSQEEISILDQLSAWEFAPAVPKPQSSSPSAFFE